MASGSIKKRQNKSGTVYDVYYRDQAGKQHKKAFKLKRDAEAFLAKTLSEINRGEYQPIKDILFKDLANKWFELKKSQVRPKTYASYKAHVDRLNNYFGDSKVKTITTEEVETFASELSAQNIGPATVARCLVILTGILKAGMRWGYLGRNPAEFLKKPKVPVPDMDYLTPEEIAGLIEATDERHKTLIMLSAFTGMRQSEILALRWSDIDFTSGKIYVRQTLQNGKFYEPKTDKSKRAVVIPLSLVEALKVHRARQAVELEKNPHDLVFTNTVGSPIPSRNLSQRIFEPALKRAGLRKVGFHSLRHSYVSVLLDQGADIKFIQNQVGHASAKITLDIYSHMLPGREQETMQKLETAMLNAQTSL